MDNSEPGRGSIINPAERVRVMEDGENVIVLGSLSDYGEVARETAKVLCVIAARTDGLPTHQKNKCIDHSHMRAVLANYYHSIQVYHISNSGDAKAGLHPPKIYMSTSIRPDFLKRVLVSARNVGTKTKTFHEHFMRTMLIALMRATSFFDELGRRYEGFDRARE